MGDSVPSGDASVPEWMLKFKKIGQKGEEGKEGGIGIEQFEEKFKKRDSVPVNQVPIQMEKQKSVRSWEKKPKEESKTEETGKADTSGDDNNNAEAGVAQGAESLNENNDDTAEADKAKNDMDNFLATYGNQSEINADQVIAPQVMPDEDKVTASPAEGGGVEATTDENQAAEAVAVPTGEDANGTDDDIPFEDDEVEVLVDENGEELEDEEILEEEHEVVYVDENGNEILQEDEEVLVDENGDEIVDNSDAPVADAVALSRSTAAVAPAPAAKNGIDPPGDDIENQKKKQKQKQTMIERAPPRKREKISPLVPICFCVVIITAFLVVLFLVILDDDETTDKVAPITLPPVVPIFPGIPGGFPIPDVAGTMPLDPFQAGGNLSCDFTDLMQPHVIDQCACGGSIDILANDVIARYQNLVETFIPTITNDFTDSITSCSVRNQALVWLSTGVNNAGESEELRLQRFALAELFIEMGGETWSDSTNWLSENSVCTWFGVSCGDQRSVQGLALDGNNLSGEVRAVPFLTRQSLFVVWKIV
jgi:hypothetical protein